MVVAAQFGSIRLKYPTDVAAITTSSGGSLAAGSGLFTIQGHNRVGVNIATDAYLVSWSNNQKIVITLKPAIRNNGEDLFKVVISFSPSSNLPAFQVAEWVARESDQLIFKSLPATIQITHPKHLQLQTITNISQAPSNQELINGKVIILGGKAYRYDATATKGDYAATPGGYWLLEPKGAYPNSATSGSADVNYGSNTPILESTLLFAPPPKTTNLTTPITYWWRNDFTPGSGEILTPGTRFTLAIAINNNIEDPNGNLYAQLFNNLVETRFKGYVDITTGILDTTVPESLTWTKWRVPQTSMILPNPLSPGFAAIWEVRFNFPNNQFKNVLPKKAQLTYTIQRENLIPSPTELGNLLGDCVLPTGNQLLVVPNKRLSGVAVLGNPATGFLQTPLLPEEELIGYSPDVAGQKVLLTNSGSMFIKLSDYTFNPDTEALRAIISTAHGISKLSSPIQFEVSGNSVSIKVAVTYPVDNGKGVIRGDYPDKLIAGNKLADFTPELLAVWLKNKANNKIYRKIVDVTIAPTNGKQDFYLLNFADLEEVSSLPIAPPLDFSLFAAPTCEVTLEASGSLFPNAQYEIYLAYNYISPNFNLTAITHDVAFGCLPTTTDTLINTINTISESSLFRGTVDNLDGLRDIAAPVPQEVRLVKDPPGLFWYDTSATQPDNDLNIVKPTAKNIGRYFLILAPGGSGNGGDGGGDGGGNFGQNVLSELKQIFPTSGILAKQGQNFLLLNGPNNLGHFLRTNPDVPSKFDFYSFTQAFNEAYDNRFGSDSSNPNTIPQLLEAISLVNQVSSIPHNSLLIAKTFFGEPNVDSIGFVAPAQDSSTPKYLKLAEDSYSWGELELPAQINFTQWLAQSKYLPYKNKSEERINKNYISKIIDAKYGAGKPLIATEQGFISPGIPDYAAMIEGIEKIESNTTNIGDPHWDKVVLLVQGDQAYLEGKSELEIDTTASIVFDHPSGKGYSYRFNDISDRLIFPSSGFIPQTAFTFEFWIKLLSPPANNEPMIILNRQTQQGTEGDIFISLMRSSTSYSFGLTALSNNLNQINGVNFLNLNIPLNQWNHFVIQYDSSLGLVAFMNGYGLSSSFSSGNPTNFATSFSTDIKYLPWVIGGSLNSDIYWAKNCLMTGIRFTRSVARYPFGTPVGVAAFDLPRSNFDRFQQISTTQAKYRVRTSNPLDTWLFI